MRQGSRVVARLFLVVAAALLATCGGHSPTQPGGTAGTSLAVYVGPAPGMPPLVSGAQSYVTAWLRLPDGTSTDCTATASWRTSNPAVATVAPAGTLNAIGAGSVAIIATCSGVTASATVNVYDGAALTGIVRTEAGAPLEGASVHVQDGKYGHASTTDAAGRYRIAGIARGGTYQVNAGKAGYESAYLSVTLAAAETVEDFSLKVGFSVYGTVTETDVGPLEGAAIEVVAGVNAGRTATSSSRGVYGLDHMLPGRFTLRASKAGYDAAEQSIDTSVSEAVDFGLRSSYGGCLVSIDPLVVQDFPSAGGAQRIQVNANASRAWAAVPDQPWIEVDGNAGATGPGSVLLRIRSAAPGATDNRSAVVRVGCGPSEGQSVRVSQLPDCQATITAAADSASFTAAGGTGHLVVRTGTPGCHWHASSQSDWIRTVGVNDWYGDLEAFFVVEANHTGAARTGLVVVAEKNWEVRQAGQ